MCIEQQHHHYSLFIRAFWHSLWVELSAPTIQVAVSPPDSIQIWWGGGDFGLSLVLYRWLEWIGKLVRLNAWFCVRAQGFSLIPQRTHQYFGISSALRTHKAPAPAPALRLRCSHPRFAVADQKASQVNLCKSLHVDIWTGEAYKLHSRNGIIANRISHTVSSRVVWVHTIMHLCFFACINHRRHAVLNLSCSSFHTAHLFPVVRPSNISPHFPSPRRAHCTDRT